VLFYGCYRGYLSVILKLNFSQMLIVSDLLIKTGIFPSVCLLQHMIGLCDDPTTLSGRGVSRLSLIICIALCCSVSSKSKKHRHSLGRQFFKIYRPWIC